MLKKKNRNKLQERQHTAGMVYTVVDITDVYENKVHLLINYATLTLILLTWNIG